MTKHKDSAPLQTYWRSILKGVFKIELIPIMNDIDIQLYVTIPFLQHFMCYICLLVQ